MNEALEKPVRINGNEKMRTFNEKVRHGLEHALNFMLGTSGAGSVLVSPFEPFLMPIESYLQAYKKESVMVKAYVDKAYKGELYWFFEMKAALALGGMLRMLPSNALAEKVNEGKFDEIDQDAFGEVGNQLNGILDRAFRTLTSKDLHLKMDFQKRVYPHEKIQVDTFLNKEEYVVLLSSMTVPPFGSQKLTLLLPRSFYETMLNLEIELDGIQPKKVLVHSWNADSLTKVKAEMSSRYTKVITFDTPEDVLQSVEATNIGAVGLDFKELSFPLAHQQLILLKRFLANRSLMRLPVFLSCGNCNEESVKELKKLGFPGATSKSFESDFPTWAQSFTNDPSWAAKHNK